MIDGFSGTGKVLQKVASALGTYIDSVMYRCVNLFYRHQIDFEMEKDVSAALDEILISFQYNKMQIPQRFAK